MFPLVEPRSFILDHGDEGVGFTQVNFKVEFW